ncbi:MAG: prepilin-type N-terminal cleavage/methylation domain-containing protein [Elusimicrobia bacterium]|nr:prepilin-type N-terminal cleavage/methylation domain-containing protein [Elusimicrobiota bacterium]
MINRKARARAGFTLIELLVVVLIIGILASIAIPQYFKVVERARIAEAEAFISQVKQAQERYLARQGNYIQTNADLTKLDITFSGSSPNFGMKFFTVAVGAGSATGCTAGDPYYSVSLVRITSNAGIATRYGTSYTALYERCLGTIDYGTCANCNTDFKN